MRLRLAISLLAVFFGACSPATDESTQETVEQSPSTPSVVADSVYTNGKIYTVNERQPWAEAVAIKDGRFIVVGSISDVAEIIGENTGRDRPWREVRDAGFY